MTRLAAVLFAILVAAGGATVFVVSPALLADSGDELSEVPTATATPNSGASVADSTTTATVGTAPTEPRSEFVTRVESVKRCGQTCRDVTSTVTNEGSAGAAGVTVYVRLFAGQGTSGNLIWTGTEDVGRLPAGASHATVTRVELSLMEAAAVQGADGWITIQTTIQSNQRTVTFAESRQVA